jgi:hypothetical protein
VPCHIVDDGVLLDHAYVDVERKVEISGCYAVEDRPKRFGR